MYIWGTADSGIVLRLVAYGQLSHYGVGRWSFRQFLMASSILNRGYLPE